MPVARHCPDRRSINRPPAPRTTSPGEAHDDAANQALAGRPAHRRQPSRLPRAGRPASDRVVIGIVIASSTGSPGLGFGRSFGLGRSRRARQVTITVTEADGCVATPNTVPAGQVTFVITNVDALGVTEVELVVRPADRRRTGEPGARLRQHLLRPAGRRHLPGLLPRREHRARPFTVTGEAAAQSADLTALLNQATIDYATYVDDQISFLLVPVQELAAAIKAGDLAAAQAAYIKARPFYERIEPVAESFPDLDPAIDLRIGDVEAGTTWTGFHPIEQGLFEKQSTDGLSALADQLVADVQTLQTQAAKLSDATRAGTAGGYQAFEIANGASALLDEVLASKITGEEEAYSKIDLLDFEANVEGSLQAFATLEARARPDRPDAGPADLGGLRRADRRRWPRTGTRRRPSGWTPYDQLTAEDKKALTDALLAVQEPLSAISAKITN